MSFTLPIWSIHNAKVARMQKLFDYKKSATAITLGILVCG